MLVRVVNINYVYLLGTRGQVDAELGLQIQTHDLYLFLVMLNDHESLKFLAPYCVLYVTRVAGLILELALGVLLELHNFGL